jgi:hypothetical protein
MSAILTFCHQPGRRLTLEAGIKDSVRKALRDRQIALAEFVHAVREYRRIAESEPLTLQGSEYPQAVHELNKAIDRAEGLLITNLSLGKMPLR